MKAKKLFLSMLGVLAMATAFTSCSSDDDDDWNDDGSKLVLPKSRAYIMNQGTQSENNSGIEFYAPNHDGEIIDDIFYKQNGARLGDTGQAMIEYDGKVFIAVHGSNYLSRVNAACVEDGRTMFSADPELKGGVRSIAAEDGYIYASFYGGIVAKINASTMKIESKLTNIGKNLENMAVCDDMLYVSNSYEIVDGNFICLNNVIVIDLNTFTVKESIEVIQNPNQLVEEDDKVFLISWDYSAESYVLQMIDPKNGNKVSRIGYATEMAANDGVVYLLDSRTDYSNWPDVSTVNTFSSYNVKTGTMNSTSFLKDAPAELLSTSISMISVNPGNGDIYIATTFYNKSNGNVYRFKKDGTFVEKFDCGGQNPKAAVFFN